MGKPFPVRATPVSSETGTKNQARMQIVLVDETGAILNVPKKIAAQTDVGAVTSTDAAGANPTKAEFDALRADLLATRTVLNSLLAKMRTSGALTA